MKKTITILIAILLLAGLAFAAPPVPLVPQDLRTTATPTFSSLDLSLSSSATVGSSDLRALDVEAVHDAAMTGTSQDLYGARYWVQKAGSDTSPDSYTSYGISATANNTGSTNAGTKTTYGGYLTGIGDTAGTSTAYGLYVSGSGADTNYGLYSASGTGVFVLNAAERVYVNGTSTPQTQTRGALEVDVTTATNGVSAVNIDLDNTKTTGTGTTALYAGARSSAVVTSGNQSLYGAEIYSTKSGADTNADATNVRGVNVQAQNTGSTNAGTRTTMGGYFSGAGDTAGASTAYGIYATATGADTNWSIYANENLYSPSVAVGAATLLTVASGSVTATKSFHTLAGQGGVADDLTTIAGGTPGQFLVIMASDGAVTITVKDGAALDLQADFDLDGDKDTLTLMCVTAGNWVEIARANNN